MGSGASLVMRAAGELLVAGDEPSVVTSAMRLLGERHPRFARSLLLRDGTALRTAAAEGPGTGTPLVQSFSTEVGHGLTGTCAAQRRVLNVRDVTRDPRYLEAVEGTRSELCVPLLVRDELLGVLSVESPTVGAFTREDEEVLAAFAQLVALAIVHTRADATRRRDFAELEALSEVARRAVALDMEGTLDTAVSSFMRITTSDSVVIYLWNEATQRLVPSVVAFEPDQYPADYRERLRPLVLGEGVVGAAAKGREALIIDDVSQDPRAIALPGIPPEHKAAIVAPLIVESEVLGVIRGVTPRQ